MVLAWTAVESDRRPLCARVGVDSNGAFAETLNALVTKGALSPDDANSMTGLRQLRNLAAHGPSGEVPSHRAQEFVSMTEAIRWVISTKPPSGQVG